MIQYDIYDKIALFRKKVENALWVALTNDRDNYVRIKIAPHVSS